jgi:SAM-dependent methyltransferase
LTAQPSRCPACGSNDTREALPYVFRPRPEDAIFAGLSLWCCADCRVHYAVPCPEPDILAKYYADTYRNDGRNSAQPVGFPGDNLWYLSRGLSLAHLLRPFLPDPLPVPLRVIDIGAGYGHVLFALRAVLGKSIDAAAIEPDARCHPTLHRVADRIFSADLEGSAIPGSFRRSHAGFLLHLLEHVPDPVRFLEKVGGLLEPRGLLVLEVPHCPEARVRWYNQDVPHVPHLLFFTADALRNVLTRAKFEVLLLDSFGPPFDCSGSYDAGFAHSPVDPLPYIEKGVAPPIPYGVFAQSGPGRLFLRAIARIRT